MTSENKPVKFRKKPIVVEAMRHTAESRDAICAWVGKACQRYAIDDDGGAYELENLRIATSDGVMMARLGDWIIKGVQGEFYPCKPDDFAATYEQEQP